MVRRRCSGKARSGGRAGRAGTGGGQGGLAVTGGDQAVRCRRGWMGVRGDARTCRARCTMCDVRCVMCDAARVHTVGRVVAGATARHRCRAGALDKIGRPLCLPGGCALSLPCPVLSPRRASTPSPRLASARLAVLMACPVELLLPLVLEEASPPAAPSAPSALEEFSPPTEPPALPVLPSASKLSTKTIMHMDSCNCPRAR